jgi:outer membrane protein insertion porin family
LKTNNKYTYPVIIILFTIIQLYCFAYNLPLRLENGEVEFDFKTTSSFSDGQLKETLLLPREKYFDRNTFEEDRQRLKKFYFDNGFFDVLVDTSTIISDEGQSIDMKFKISENERYTIRELIYDGLQTIPKDIEQEIYSDQPIKSGDPFVRSLILQDRDRVINILQNNGYYWAFTNDSLGTIVEKYDKSIQDKNPDYKNKVNVKIRFKGAVTRYTFGTTRIYFKNKRIDLGKDIITRELEYKEGDFFNKSKLLESENNLSRLPIIQLGTVDKDTVVESERKVYMKVNITLGNKHELTPGIAAVYLSNKFYAGANLEYLDKNFLGGGRVFSAKLEGLINDLKNNEIDLSFTFTQPYLFNNNISLTVNPSIGLLNYPGKEYVYSKNLTRFSYFISPYTFYKNAYMDITADFIRVKYTEDQFENDVFYHNGDIVSKLNSIIGLTLVHNSTNDIFNPSKGGFHSITIESAGLLPKLLSLLTKNLSYSQYFKFYIPIRYYKDVSGNRTAIAALNLEIGDIIEYGSGDKIIPIDPLYKFFSGGGNSLRGWRAQRNGILTNTLNGGKFLLEGNAEYRWNPLSDVSNFTKNIWVVGFFDYGNVWETHKDFIFSQIAMATGLGIRYNTFVGPIRIDVGFKLFDPSAEKGNRWLWDNPSEIFKTKYAIHFGIGNAF